MLTTFRPGIHVSLRGFLDSMLLLDHVIEVNAHIPDIVLLSTKRAGFSLQFSSSPSSSVDVFVFEVWVSIPNIFDHFIHYSDITKVCNSIPTLYEMR